MNKILLLTGISILFSINIFSQSYEELVKRSSDYIEDNDYFAAEQTLKAALRKEPANPGNSLLLSNLGTVQRNLKKYDEALISYNAALAQHPLSMVLLNNRASLYCEIDSLNLALEDYNSILFGEPNNVDVLYRRGLIYCDTGKLDLAEADFQKIKEITPNSLLGPVNIALVLKRQGKWQEAEDLYSDLLYDNRNIATLYINRAECFLENKKPGRAQEDLNKALSLGSQDPLLYILKGRLNLQQYDKNTAKTAFLKAKSLGADEKVIAELLLYCK